MSTHNMLLWRNMKKITKYPPYLFHWHTACQDRGGLGGVILCCCCLFGFNVAFNNFSVMSGCDRDLNDHFHSAASLKYHVPDT